MPNIKYIANCFWLLVPILWLNIFYAKALPPAFQPDIFWEDIPAIISWPENTLRLVTIMFPLLMPLGFSTQRQKAGWTIYLVGLAAYVSSWGVLITAPNAIWSTSLAGFLAPAFTPAIWFIGIWMIGGHRLNIRAIPYASWMYLLLLAGFIIAHNAHAYLVYSRL